jgi:Family of unknown function (DUF6232)
MITYYDDRSVQVTSSAIQVDDQVYRFDDLSRVWHRREKKPWRELAGRGFWGVTYLFPFAGAAVGIVVAAILVGLSAAPLLDPILDKLDSSFDRGLYVHEIWVERFGVEILVLQTRDGSRFGRIYRAVQRATGA